MLLNFWVRRVGELPGGLEDLQPAARALGRQGLQLLTVNVDDLADADKSPGIRSRQPSFISHPAGIGRLAGIYNILYRYLFDRHRDLSLPTSFLINVSGEIVKVYQGPVNPEHVEQDFQHIPANCRRETG